MHFTFPHAGYFGYGSAGTGADNNVYSGGGGWYGGSGGNNGGEGGSTGGSSFISGMSGCVAIALPVTRIPASGEEVWFYLGSPPTNPDRYGVKGWRYQERTSGDISVMTIGGRDYIFTHPSMVDGQGYQWNTGSKGAQSNMPDYATSGTMTGNAGNGYARITLLGD